MPVKQSVLALNLAWALGLVVCALALTAWGNDFNWQVWPLENYILFPLLGLLAFSLMWTHYVVGTIRDLAGVSDEITKPYYRYTGYAVLVLICLHPGLLVYQRFRDGAGLPPGSYYSYVAPSMKWITMLGLVSLLVFLAFELHRKYGEKPWFRYVQDSSDLAMLAIVYHGLQLGSNLQQGWFQYVWWFYATTLVLVLIRKYSLRFSDWQAGPNAQSKKPGT